MEKNVIIADSSELILKGLKSILQPFVENEIIFSLCFSDLYEQVEALKDIFVSEPDIEAPCLVLWNKDESDAEEVKEDIMILNLMNKQ